ncbi:hypothetical protein AB1285_14235 [Microbacterium sp. NRRL B-14842]|uniref:hypothetical protein n=1 Tax=Microbacterium sp. NRRL B-14842 TaxID=3162881 RepID=UPI003511317D
MFGKQPEGWFSTITKPRRHLIATLGVWTWFIAAFMGGGLLPHIAPVLEVTAMVGVASWYVAMMRSYRSGLRRSDGP